MALVPPASSAAAAAGGLNPGSSVSSSSSAITTPVVGRVFTVASPEFSSGGFAWLVNSVVNAAWASINDPVAVPFRLALDATAVQLGWRNGTVVADSVDVGLYDASFNRLTSSGSVASVGASLWQWADVVDQVLAAGLTYYLVMASNGVTASARTFVNLSSAPAMDAMGCKETATDSFPLPNPLVGMTAPSVAGRVPLMGFATRAPF